MIPAAIVKKGSRAARLPLNKSSSGGPLSFIRESGHVVKMDRVVAFADGKVACREEKSGGVVVEKIKILFFLFVNTLVSHIY